MQTPGVTDEQIEQLTAQAQRAYGELSSQQALLAISALPLWCIW